MRKKVYFSFLILCVILPQRIQTLSEESMKDLSDLQVRKKRLINKTTDLKRSVTLQEVPYIVGLKENGLNICGSSILSANIVLTAAHCVEELRPPYTILSGSARRNSGRRHRVTNIQIHPLFNNTTLIMHDLALLKIFPPIDLIRSLNRKISLYNGYLYAGTLGLFSGWGCIDVIQKRLVFPAKLQAIVVPIMNQVDCDNLYNRSDIEGKGFCTGDHEGNKGSCMGDSGGPLAIDGRLAGVMSWNFGDFETKRKPDVFVNLAYPLHRNWIISTINFFESIRG